MLGLAFWGLAPSSFAAAAVPTHPRAAAAPLDFARLGSLDNYSGTMTNHGLQISVDVHSPTDWSETLGHGSPIIYVDNYSYGKSVDARGKFVWYKNRAPRDVYQQSPYPGAVAGFRDFDKVAGRTITRGKPCTVAGIPGRLWTIASPRTHYLSESDTACIANGSGALLEFYSGAAGSVVPKQGWSYSFIVTSVGRTASIPVPSPVVTG